MGASRIARSFPRFSATCWAWEGLPLNPRQGPEGGRGEQASAFEAACGLGVRPLRAPRNPGQTSPPPAPPPVSAVRLALRRLPRLSGRYSRGFMDALCRVVMTSALGSRRPRWVPAVDERMHPLQAGVWAEQRAVPAQRFGFSRRGSSWRRDVWDQPPVG